jgi:hypothetical protein
VWRESEPSVSCAHRAEAKAIVIDRKRPNTAWDVAFREARFTVMAKYGVIFGGQSQEKDGSVR